VGGLPWDLCGERGVRGAKSWAKSPRVVRWRRCMICKACASRWL
jgi:hypothetical protein